MLILVVALLALPCGSPEDTRRDPTGLPLHLVLEEADADRLFDPGPPDVREDPGPRGPIPGPSSAQEPPPKPAPQDPGAFEPPHGSGVASHFSGKAWKEYVWEDYLTEPAVLLPLGLAASAAAISHWDKEIQQKWFGVLGAKGHYSDIGQYTLLGSAIFLGIVFPGEGRNSWDEFWTMGESYAASALTTYVLKTTVQRPRPGNAPNTGTGTHSFPSGHSSSAFTSATLIERNSGLVPGLPAYALAGFTAFERVEEGHHYPSDVLAGAAIGTLSASIFDHLHWGTGPGGGGIARPPEAKLGFVDGLHGFQLECSWKF